MALLVMKFGGTSVGTAPCIRRAAELVGCKASDDRVVVVVSALGGVTDRIVEALHAAKEGAIAQVTAISDALRSRHYEVVGELFPAAQRPDVEAAIDSSIVRLLEICSGMAQLRASAPQIADMALSLGEEISAVLFTAYLEKRGTSATYVDAARVVVTDAKFGDATPDMDSTRRRARAELLPILERGCVPVVTGYRSATAAGQLTTLGRGGSDYSATILGSVLEADEIWIWTDVDGVLTADPRICGNAATLDEITFAEAVELSHYGAKVVHQRAIQPARDAGIPLRIKNSFRPDAAGTRIACGSSANARTVKAVTAVKDASLITISTGQNVHPAELFGRLLMRLAANHIDLLFSTQSSQNALGLVVRERDEHHVLEVIRRVFPTEIRHGVLNPVSVEQNVAVIAVLGEAMKGHPGILARLFSAVAKRNVSVIAVAQGASELNICFAVPAAAANEVVQAVHDEFCGAVPQEELSGLNQQATSPAALI
jgi:bifunctional aspartokinase / homoserine dehydrogenase 1